MTPFHSLTSKAALLPIDDVDTDQIIPARYLKGTSKEGLGKNLFADWRYDGSGEPRPDFALNRPEAEGANILVSGANFGCGSSREHAPWALVSSGFRAVIAPSFADIFRNNALKNGLLPVAIAPEAHARILEICSRNPNTRITIELADESVRVGDDLFASFAIDPFAKHCLLQGVDELGYLLSLSDQIAKYEAAHG